MRWLALAALAVCAHGHTYHASIAQVEYITAKQALEVMVWLHTEDIERAFQAAHGPQANFDDAKAAERFVAGYLQQHFVLRDKQGQPLAQRWVGMELKVNFLTVYLELPLPQGYAGVTLDNRILLDRLPDQTNSVQVKQDGQARRELQFTAATRGARQPL